MGLADALMFQPVDGRVALEGSTAHRNDKASICQVGICCQSFDGPEFNPAAAAVASGLGLALPRQFRRSKTG